MALFTLSLAACPYLRPPDFREPFFFAAMKFLLLQFRQVIATQGCRESGADLKDRLRIFLDSRNERQRISPTQPSETLTPRDEIFRMKPREFLEDAFRVASDSLRRLRSHREPKGQKDHPWRQGYLRYQAQPFASRDIAARWNAHSNDTTTAACASKRLE
jgi:hypothetical protein